MESFKALLLQKFPYTPTQGQDRLFDLLASYLLQQHTTSKKNIFVLKGYAGTGKTSALSALVNSLHFIKKKAILLTPTGRAAKVMAAYAKRKAFTIHKLVFKQTEDPNTGRLYFVRQKNYHRNTVFIVDEASMIDNSQETFTRTGLLDELLQFVFEDSEANNQLILVGDAAQLPPVHQSISPALDTLFLESHFNSNVHTHLLTEVVRQKEASGILDNATALRLSIAKRKFQVQFKTKHYPDIYAMGHQKLEDGLRYAYDKFGIENTCLITRSNKSAVNYNQYIRRQLLYYENEIDAGDFLMIVRNNYFWLSADSQAGFLANGEFVEIRRIRNQEEIKGFNFADITFQLIDYPNEPTFEAKVLLNPLHSSSASMPNHELKKLYEEIQREYAHIESEKELNNLIKNDPYLNALQVKYAYALTCHKAQGGQWDAVFVDIGFLTEEMKNVEYLRWLYTAVTRSTKELYLINFPKEFFAQ